MNHSPRSPNSGPLSAAALQSGKLGTTMFRRKNFGFTTFNNEKYYVASLHFHTPSEHRLNGKQYPLEAHMVHASKSGDLTVVSKLFDYPWEKPYRKKITAFDSDNSKEFGLNHFVENFVHQLMNNQQEEVRTNLNRLMKWGGFLFIQRIFDDTTLLAKCHTPE